MVDKSIPTKEEIERLRTAAEETRKYAEAIKDKGETEKKVTEASLAAAKAERDLLNAKKELTDIERTNLAELEKKIKRLSELKAIQNEAADSLGNFLSKNAQLPGKMGWLDKFITSGTTVQDVVDSLKDKFTNASGELDKLGLAAGITGVAFQRMYTQTVDTAKSAFDLEAGLVASTGAGSELADSAYEAADTIGGMGMQMSRAFEATTALKTSMSSFSAASIGSTDALIATTAELSALGISMETTAQNSEFMTRQLGMSADQASQAANDQARFAMSIGVAPAKMAEDFKQAGPKLAVYGKNATKVFEGLARTSKNLGVEMSSLLSITEQFDTFEQAADAAGQLNAALGGQFLDAMQMHNATEEERIQLMQQAIAASGQEFDQMSKYEKKLVANSLGISDMNEATRILSKSNQDLGKTLEQRMVTEDDLAERKKASVSLDERLTAAKQNLAVAIGPLVSIMSFFLNLLNKPVIRETIQGLVILTSTVYMAVKAVQFMKGAMIALQGTVATYKAVQAAVKAQEGATGLMRMVNAARTFLMAKANTSLAVSNGAVAGSSLGAAAGTAAVGKAGAGAAGGIASLGVALLKLSVAVFLIGAGIGIAAAGMSLLVTAFTALLQLVIDNIAQMPLLLLSLFGLNLMFQLMGVSLIIAGAGFQFLAVSLATFVAIGVPAILTMLLPMKLLSFVVGGLALSIGLLGLGFAFIAAGAAATAVSIISMIGALTNFSTDENGFTKFVTVVESIDSADVDNLGAVVDEAQRYVMVQAQLNTMSAMQSIADGITGLLNIANGNSEADRNRQKEVVLELNNREFARAVVESLDGKLNASIM